VLRRPFDPWQEFAVVHAGEMLPDGRPRFRLVLVIVARQNGKTEVPVILSLHWLFVDRWPLVLGTSTKLDYAQESWEKAIAAAKPIRALWRRVPKRGGVRRANGEQVLKTEGGSRYKIAASNDEGGRSLTIDRLVLDELRQHHDYSAWGASEPAVSARPRGQIWGLSNAGDDRSVVLNDKRAEALAFIRWWDEHGDERVAGELLAGRRPDGMPDFRIGIFEWSADEDFDDEAPPDEIMRQLMQANPNAGHPEHGADPDELLASYYSAKRLGGAAWSTYKTERMCIRVVAADAAIDAAAWRRGRRDDLDLAGLRVALVVDVSPDMEHATLTAAAKTGRYRVVTVLDKDGVPRDIEVPVIALDVVEAWEGPTAVTQMSAAVPRLVAKIRPAAFGYLPGGPAAAAASTLRNRNERGKHYAWPPVGVQVIEIKQETAGVCMGFAADVKGDLIEHGDDPLQNAHVEGADKLYRGDVWVFARRRPNQPDVPMPHVDAAYSAAGAVWLAKTLPDPISYHGLVSADDDD
jgi:hypothetical protein